MDAQVDGKTLNHTLFAGGGFGVTAKEEPDSVIFEGDSYGVSLRVERWIADHPHHIVGKSTASFSGRNQVWMRIEYTQKNQNE
jgi:hypothetical protein